MVTLEELDLSISLENAIDGEVFDRDEIKQGTSIQPVDLIFEMDEYFLFVEVKDPDVPGGASTSANFRVIWNQGKL